MVAKSVPHIGSVNSKLGAMHAAAGAVARALASRFFDVEARRERPLKGASFFVTMSRHGDKLH
jgi:hypothetical protein